MRLTRKEKTKIFWTLINSYSEEYVRCRKQAEMFFKDEELDRKIKIINKEEDDHYNLLKKLADDLNIKLPEKVKR